MNEAIAKLRASNGISDERKNASTKPYFDNEDECREWREAHKTSEIKEPELKEGDVLDIYIGIDAGSTTTKTALISEDGSLLYSFYSNNNGSPFAFCNSLSGIMNTTGSGFNPTYLIDFYSDRTFGFHFLFI